MLQKAAKKEKVRLFLATKWRDPERFGVVEFDEDLNAISIEENRRILDPTMQWQVFISMIMMLGDCQTDQTKRTWWVGNHRCQ